VYKLLKILGTILNK